MLEAIARYRGRSGLAEVAVDDTNVLGRPAGSNRAVTQRILTLRTLAVLGDLTQRRLTDVEIGVALEMSAVTLSSAMGTGELRCKGDGDSVEIMSAVVRFHAEFSVSSAHVFWHKR